MKVIKRFENVYKGKARPWSAVVLYSDATNRYYVRVESATDWYGDWPIKYEGGRYGRIAYDHPERIPQYAKDLASRAFLWMEKEGLKELPEGPR